MLSPIYLEYMNYLETCLLYCWNYSIYINKSYEMFHPNEWIFCALSLQWRTSLTHALTPCPHLLMGIDSGRLTSVGLTRILLHSSTYSKHSYKWDSTIWKLHLKKRNLMIPHLHKVEVMNFVLIQLGPQSQAPSPKPQVPSLIIILEIYPIKTTGSLLPRDKGCMWWALLGVCWGCCITFSK